MGSSTGHRRRSAGTAFALAAWLGAQGCAPPSPDLVRVEVRIGAADPVCRPRAVRAVRLTLEGDFRPTPTDTFELLTAAGVRDLAGLRGDVLDLVAEVDGDGDYRAFGRSSLEALRRTSALAVLPPLWPCSLLDPDAFAPPGAAVVAHPDGTAWIVGGMGVGRRVVRIDPRATFSRVVPDALYNPRIGASATAAGDEVVVAGGAARERDGAFDTYERLGADQTPVAGSPGGRLSMPRRDHAAALVGTRLVLVGGRTGGSDDALVERIDVVDLASGRAHAGPALSAPRTSPALVPLSDGSLLVAGGWNAVGSPVATLERVLPDLETIVTLPLDLPPPDFVLGIGLERLFHVAAGIARIVDLRADPPEVVVLGTRGRLRSAVAVRTPSGRVVAFGTDEHRVEIWAPHLDSVRSLTGTMLASKCARLTDGAVLAIGSAGASLLALEEPGPWTSLPNDRLLLPSDFDSPFLVVARPDDFEGARARRDGALLSLAPLFFGALSLTLDAEGAYTIRLRDAASDRSLATIAVESDGRASGPGCLVSASPERLVVSRERDRLALLRGEERRPCDPLPPGSWLAIEVELRRGTSLHAIQAIRAAD